MKLILTKYPDCAKNDEELIANVTELKANLSELKKNTVELKQFNKEQIKLNAVFYKPTLHNGKK